MSSVAQVRRKARTRRHKRIRKAMAGTADVPRLAVFRSHLHIYVQVIDDLTGRSLAGTSTLDPAIRGELTGKKKTERSRIVGKRVAEIALGHGIQKVAFDRGGYLYHGRIRALAEGAREGGLQF
jgi:large subunit ribosomal protein L18